MRERWKEVTEKLFEVIQLKIFSYLMKIVNPETQVSSSISPLSKVNTYIHAHLQKLLQETLSLNCWKLVIRKKILEATSWREGKEYYVYKEIKTKSQQTNQNLCKSEDNKRTFLKCWRKEKCPSHRIPYLEKISFKNEGERKQKLRKCCH